MEHYTQALHLISFNAAITREKQIKSGSRNKKLFLIETKNPEWQDLYNEIIK